MDYFQKLIISFNLYSNMMNPKFIIQGIVSGYFVFFGNGLINLNLKEFGIVLFIGGILILIIGFILPMAIAMYAKSDKIGDAFKISESLNRIKSIFGEYLISYIIIVIFGIILGLIGLIPIIGWILSFFGTFYLGVAALNMFGELYIKSKA